MTVGKRGPRPPRVYTTAAAATADGGRTFTWAGHGAAHGVIEWAGLAHLPAERVWCWQAESLATHVWCDYPTAASRAVQAWFGGGRLSTVKIGNAFVCSASRWSSDRLDDAGELLELGESVQRTCLALGVNVKGSPGSAAIAVYKSLVPRGRFTRTSQRLNEFASRAIYGGRAEAYLTGKVDRATQWDRRSAYLSHLAEPLPIPGGERYVSGAAVDLETPGLTEADVRAPAGVCRLPVLPVKARGDQGARTVFPWGTFRGVWTNEELLAARERGYEIKPRHGVTLRLVRSHAFSAFAARVWGATQSGFPLAKRIGVAMVGKLHGGRTSREVIPWGPFKALGEAEHALQELLACPKHPKLWRTGKRCECPRQVSAELRERAHVAIVLRRRPDFLWYVNNPVAAYVLARARLELLRVAEANMTPDAIPASVNTDGMIVLGGSGTLAGARTGDGLGEWRQEYGPASGEIHGPAAYTLTAPGAPTKSRAPGIARIAVEKFLKGEEPARWETRLGVQSLLHGTSKKKSAYIRSPIYTGFTSRDQWGEYAPHEVALHSQRNGKYVNVLIS